MSQSQENLRTDERSDGRTDRQTLFHRYLPAEAGGPITFQDILYRKFYNYESYKDIKPDSNQPKRLYGTAKTHKFENLEDITLANLKFRPKIDQTGTYTYRFYRIIKELYFINNTKKFLKICYLQFHFSKMTRKMYHVMSSHYS